MRVLLINHFPLFGSGSGVYTLNIANSLLRLGHEVVALFPDNHVDDTPYGFRTHPVYFTDADGKAPVADALPFNFPCFTTHPRSTNTFEALTDEELEAYLDAFRRAIAQEVEEFKPDVIHAGHIWLLAQLAGQTGLPLVVTAHGTDLIGYRQSTRYHDAALEAATLASSIVAISERNLAEVVETFPFAEGKTRLISNGYDDARFYPADVTREEVLSRYGITRPYPKLVSFAGKFAHFKGIDILLRAAALYEDEDTATVLAGDGELFDEMNRLAMELELENVYFIHAQKPDALRDLYSVADVSLAPSRKEPFGLVVIEAGACGAPVVGTDGGGIADILTPSTGILIPEEDHEALAAAVTSVLSGERVFDSGHIARYTKDHFSQGQYTRELVDELYRPACDGGSDDA